MTKLTSLQKDAIREATKLDDLDQKHKDLLLDLLKDDDKYWPGIKFDKEFFKQK